MADPTRPELPEGMVSLTIDDQPVMVPRGTLIVEAAKRIGIEIPVFCYHHKLNPVGACRLCLVDVSPGPPKPQTACTTPVAQDMVVRTNSVTAVEARADILEFELVNHPLDCPVCDKGGECPLQDFTFRHGYPVSRLNDPKNHFRKPVPLSDQIALDRERCVLCYRCTRYYDEITWEQELTVDERGARAYITSQFDQPLQSNFSGNIIDLCPVGALTSRVWRFESRPWDMQSAPSVCSKCSVGCNVTLWQRRHQLVRVTSRENDAIDDGWICDRGRFDYTHVNDRGRLRVPEVGGRRTTWDEAFQAVIEGLRPARGARLGIALPGDITNEEAFVLSRLLAGPWKGARVAMSGRSTLELGTGLPPLAIQDIERAATVIVVASDTRYDVPILNLRIKKAANRGARIIEVGAPGARDLARAQDYVRIECEPGAAAEAVRGLIGVGLIRPGPVAVLYGDGHGTERPADLVAAIADLATAHQDTAALALLRATNERGALSLGILNATDLAGCEAVFCWGEPAPGLLPTGSRFNVILDSLRRERHPRADVLLPDITFAERQGTYTNLAGQVQTVLPVLPVVPPLRESWEILAELGVELGADVQLAGILDLQEQLARQVPELRAPAPLAIPGPASPVLMGPARP